MGMGRNQITLCIDCVGLYIYLCPVVIPPVSETWLQADAPRFEGVGFQANVLRLQPLNPRMSHYRDRVNAGERVGTAAFEPAARERNSPQRRSREG